MDKYKMGVIALPSVTFAMSAVKLLAAHGIAARVVKLNADVTRKGCANGIELDRRNLYKARDLLIERSIPVSEVV